MDRASLLQRIHEICFNDQDSITLDDWSSLTVPELRTVIALIDDGGAEEIMNASPSPRTRARRGNCFLLEGLARWVRSNPTNPRTRRPITARQRDVIENAYRRQRQLRRRPLPPFNPSIIPDMEATGDMPPPPTPQAPRVRPGTAPRFFTPVGEYTLAGRRNSRGVGTATRQRFDGRTIVNVNGRRLTVDGATLSIARTRQNGRDSYVITLDYTSP